MYVERRAGVEAWLFERLFDREMNDKFRVSFSMVCYLEMYIFKMFCDIYIYIHILCKRFGWKDVREFKRGEKYLWKVKKISLNRIENLRNNLHILTFKEFFFSLLLLL